jgi:hypothetical protein
MALALDQFDISYPTFVNALNSRFGISGQFVSERRGTLFPPIIITPIRAIDSPNRPNGAVKLHHTPRGVLFNMNTTIIVGRVTKAIRTNTVQDSPVVNFTAAFEFGSVPKMLKIDGRDTLVYIPTTTFIDCAAWNKDADAAAGLEPGQEVTVQITSMTPQGRLYDAGDGNGTKVFADITARVTNIVPGAKKRLKAANGTTGAPAAAVAGAEEPDLSEIPF